MQSLRFSFVLEFNCAGRYTDMSSDWAKQLVNSYRSRQEEKRLVDQKTISDRELVKNNAPKKWGGICDLIRQFSEELNQENGSPVLVVGAFQNAIQITATGNPEPLGTLTFDLKNNTLAVPFHGCELRL